LWVHYAEHEFMEDKRVPPLTTMFTDIEISFHLLQQIPTRTSTNPFREKLNTIFKNICYHEFIKEPHIVKTIKLPQLRAHLRFIGERGEAYISNNTNVYLHISWINYSYQVTYCTPSKLPHSAPTVPSNYLFLQTSITLNKK
jgi:hypothetical protein